MLAPYFVEAKIFFLSKWISGLKPDEGGKSHSELMLCKDESEFRKFVNYHTWVHQLLETKITVRKHI